MAKYTFQARDKAGRTQSGMLEAPGPAAAVQQIRQRGWMVTDIRAAQSAETLGEQLSRLNPLEHLPPRSIDIELSCKQLALMLRGGLTLLTSLETVASQTGRPSLRRAWRHVASRLQEGASFAEAMTEAGCFPRVLVQLVRVGEQTGQLEQTIERATEAMESRRRLRTSLLTALAYPTVVLVAAVGVTIFMVVGVIPKLAAFLSGRGKRLPAMTQFLLDLSAFTNRYLIHMVVAVCLIFIATIVLYMRPRSRLVMDRWLLRVPVIGHLLRLAGTASFSRALGILVRSGITVLEGLRTVEELVRNHHLSRRVASARETLMQGGNLAGPLSEARAFSPMLARMVAVGESSGTLDEVLDEVARFHEAQLQTAIRNLSTIIEPVIIVLVGGIVGFVYIAFFVALFSAGGV